MNANIFEFHSYRQYLKTVLESQGPKSGLKRLASESLSVHTTFISQVVLGKADLSLDQAERMNSFLNHTEDEGEFFLNLVILERAGDPKLRLRYEAKIKNKYNEHIQIVKHLDRTEEVPTIEQEKFYSSHIYSLLHVLSSIPSLQTREALAEATGFPLIQTNEAIDFMIQLGILKSAKNKISHGERSIHLKKASREINRHHANWRLATLQRMPFDEEADLHYSLAFSCSKSDAVKLREMVLKNLKKMSETIGSSKEETA